MWEGRSDLALPKGKRMLLNRVCFSSLFSRKCKMKSHSYAETSDVLDSPSRSSNEKEFLDQSCNESAGSALRFVNARKV